MYKLEVVILAAGGSTRMGEPKQLLKINNQTLIRKTVETALAVGSDSVLVVLGNEFEKIHNEIADLEIRVVKNPDWKRGMASSLRVAIQAIQKQKVLPDSVLLLLCDQPLITAEYLKKLQTTFQNNNKLAVASTYNNIKGVPAIFDFNTLAQFSETEGDFGARFLIKRLDKENQLAVLSFPNAAIDLDTKEDYRKFLERG